MKRLLTLFPGQGVLGFCLLGLAPALMGAQAPRVLVSGAGDALAGNIRSHLSITQESCEASMMRLQRFMPRVRERIREAARALGYYSSTYETRFVPSEDCWTLEIDIDPGEPVRVGSLMVEIMGDADTRALFSGIPAPSALAPGDQLNHGNYERVKNNLSARAVENGYFSARFVTSEIRLNLVEHRADISIVFDPGERFSFGPISINSRDILREEFLRSLIPFETGDPYSSESLAQLRRNLDDSQYFRQITISPQLARTSGRMVPLDVQLEPRPRYAYSAGVGFSTDTGPRLTLAYENRYLNRRGHRLEAGSTLSPVRSEVDLNYRVPLRDPARQTLSFSGGYIMEDTESFDSDRFKFEVSYTNESPSGWLRDIFVNHQRDDYVINEVSDKSVLTMLGANLSKTEANDLINPARGWRVFGEVTGASDALLSDVTFLQVHTRNKRVMSFGRGRVLARVEAGATWVKEEQELPVSVRFFAGGDQSVRGYPYQSLGPVNENDEVVGGKHLLVGSLEFDYRILNSWRLAVFYDVGNAFSVPSDLEWRQGAGFGIRWISPIGPIRADIAYAFEEEEGIRLHITMGPDL